MNTIEKIFDAPWPPPVAEKPFQPFPEAYITGPVPAAFQTKTVTQLAAALFRVSEEMAADLTAFGAVWLDDRPCLEPEKSLTGCRTFRLNPPAYGPARFYEADPARIIYEDRDILVYNKESGRPSQAVPHDAYNNALSAVGRLLAARGERPRLWLLHRLDADTSGLLMMAKNKQAAGILGKAFQGGQVEKEYICQGLGAAPAKDAFEVEASIAKDGRRYVVRPKGPGLAAKTSFSVLDIGEAFGQPGWRRVLFLARPLTGRTHQIRLHLAWAGWPIIGDRFYGRPEAGSAPRLMLASAGLSFTHPADGRRMTLKLDY
ncbi:MAG: RluA family pseudouridine synthase [Candidatus Adiutrix sp.]|jgi:23S rRNA pseudouridine1911/1915/1917 synthase|nr:RluA family pseudouridine synthase [Candidatus Adiutrix sp.]